MSGETGGDYENPASRYKFGPEVTVGDVIVFSGTPHRIVAIEPYDLFDSCGIARASDGWGITLAPFVAVEVA